jgi:hypothetical protein
MRSLANNPMRFMIFAMLLVYATTVDFMSTSMAVVDGQDCNHPDIRVEHKMVTKSAGVERARQASAVAPIVTAIIASTVTHAAPVWHQLVAVISTDDLLSADPQDPVPLRC